MIYLLIYLLIGMVYSALTYKKTMRFMANSILDKEEIDNVIKGKELEESTKSSLAVLFIMSIIASILKTLFYPFVILSGLGKTSKKKFID